MSAMAERASRSDAPTVAVGFSPRIAAVFDPRRGATLERSRRATRHAGF